MEDRHRKAIRANYVALNKELELDVVMASLIQAGIYEPFMVETFKAKNGKFAQNQALLNNIETRGPKAYNAFLMALLAAGQGHLANAIKSKNAPAQPQEPPEELYEPMQTEGPGRSFVSQPSDAVWPNPNTPPILDIYHIPQVPIKQEMVDSSEVYPMTSNPRGLALIINNKNFRTMPERRGTEVDGRNLEHVFKELGFNTDVKTDLKAQVYPMGSIPRGLALIINNKDFATMKARKGTDIDAANLGHMFRELKFNVDIKQNLTAQDMAATIREFTKMNHSTFDCVILSILTHGVEGAVYGVDERKLLVEDIFKYFDGVHAPTLNHKPKIIILQACRGERFDRGVESTDASGAGYAEEPAAPRPPLQEADAETLAKSMLELELEAPDAFASSRSKVPTMSDMLIAYATVPGFVSWRNSERGSWFVQALTEVILQYAQKEDVLSMLTMVNAKVAKAFESSSGRNKQMPAPVTMLTKKLFFFPGYQRQ